MLKKTLLALALVGTLALTGCTDNEPTPYKTPAAPSATTSSAPAAPQNEALINTGGVDPAQVKIPTEIAEQYANADQLARAGLDIIVTGYGNLNALQAGDKGKEAFDVLREKMTAEAWNSIVPQSQYTYDANDVVVGTGNQIVQATGIVLPSTGFIPMPDGTEFIPQAVSYTLGEPVITALTTPELIAVAPAEAVEYAQTNKVRLAGVTTAGAPAEYLFEVPLSLALVPSGNTYVAAAAVAPAPTLIGE